MIRKLHDAKARGGPVELWGSGTPAPRVHACRRSGRRGRPPALAYDSDFTINIGTGEDISIRDLAELIATVVAYDGETVWDTSKPDGTPRKVSSMWRGSHNWGGRTNPAGGRHRVDLRVVPRSLGVNEALGLALTSA